MPEAERHKEAWDRVGIVASLERRNHARNGVHAHTAQLMHGRPKKKSERNVRASDTNATARAACKVVSQPLSFAVRSDAPRASARSRCDDTDWLLGTPSFTRVEMKPDLNEQPGSVAPESGLRESANGAAERLRILTEAAHEFAEKSTDSKTLLEAVAAVVGNRWGDSCSILLVAGDGTTLEPAAFYDADRDLAAELERAAIVAGLRVGEGIAGRVVQSGRSFSAPDGADSEPVTEAARDWPDRMSPHAVLAVPLRARGVVIGAILALRHRTRHAFSVEDRRLLESLAEHAALAIDNARLFEAERAARHAAQAARRREAFLARITSVISSSLEYERTLDAIARLTVPEAADYCVLFDSRGGVLASAHRDPESEALLRRILDGIPNSPAIDVLAAKKSVLLREVPQSLVERYFPEGERRELVEALGVRSLVLAPLSARGHVIGVLQLGMTSSGRLFDDEDVELAEAIGRRAGLAIDNARLFEAQRRAREAAELARGEAETLYRVVDAANRATSLEAVYDAALSAIRQALGIERAAVLSLDADKRMRFETWRGLSDRYRAAVEGYSPWPPDDPEPEALFVSDVERDPPLEPFREVFRAEGIRALAFVPLVYQSRLLGKFTLYHGEVTVFSDWQMAVARSIADQVASALGRRVAAQEREQLIQRLRETLRTNELFAGVLGHDLRNPLNAIMTGAQLVRMRSKEENVLRAAGRILSSGERMGRMISQILDFTRIRAGGGFVLQRSRVDLGVTCQQVLDEFGTSERRLLCDTTGDPSGYWDVDRLSQVISNLVGNAVQHGARDRPIVVRLDGSRPDVVTLEVRSGGEVPSDLLPTLFLPFRGNLERTDRGQGLGLGLYITHQIVLAHGGTLDVRSQHGETAFVAVLPRGKEG